MASKSPDRSEELPRRRRTRINPLVVARMKRECEELEAEIAQLEEEIRQIELELGKFAGAERSRQLAQNLAKKRERLDLLMAKWEELATRIAQAETPA